MVEKDNDHDRIAVAKEDSEEQVQGVLVCVLSERVYLFARVFACAAERVFEQQQLDVLYGRGHEAGYDVHVWGYTETDTFCEGL